MTIFSSKAFTDAMVREQMERQFAFMTSDERPIKKGKSKNDPSITDEMWFQEFSWMHCFIFCQAFHEANARGIINPAEIAIGEELIAMMP